jgi:hypothetical protein
MFRYRVKELIYILQKDIWFFHGEGKQNILQQNLKEVNKAQG